MTPNASDNAKRRERLQLFDLSSAQIGDKIGLLDEMLWLLLGLLAWVASRFSLVPVLALTIADGILAVAARPDGSVVAAGTNGAQAIVAAFSSNGQMRTSFTAAGPAQTCLNFVSSAWPRTETGV